jgi:uncharacterized protein YfaS (alpha-2-macroglobulin family)
VRKNLLPVLALWSLLSACISVPEANVRSSLELLAPPGDEELDGPLRVAFAGPVGDAPSESEIAIVFNRPMRALGAQDAKVPPFELSPPIEGRWEWIGSRALRFVPSQGLPNATHFSIKLPAGAAGTSGQALASDYQWEFTTPSPTLTAHEPVDEQSRVTNNEAIRLHFDQTVGTEDLRKALTMMASIPAEDASKPNAIRAVEFDLSADTEGRSFRVTPRAPLPQNAQIQVTVGPMMSHSGGRPTTPRSFSFQTWGPFRSIGARCLTDSTNAESELSAPASTHCAPDAGVRLLFSNYVDAEKLAGFVEVTPEVKGLSFKDEYLEGGATGVRVHGEFEPAKSYRLRLRKRTGKRSLRDYEGEALLRDFETTITFGNRTPVAELTMSGTFGPQMTSLQVPIKRVNVKNATLKASALSREGIMARLRGGADGFTWSSPRKLNDPALNQLDYSHEPLQTLLGVSKLSGPIAVRLEYEAFGVAHSDSQEAQFSNLAVMAEIAHQRVHAWVVDRETGKAVANAEVELRGTHASSTVKAKTDASGRATLSFPENDDPSAEAQQHVLFAQLADDWNYQLVSRRPDAPEWMTSVFNDRGLYRPGDTVFFKGLVRTPSEHGLSTPKDLQLEFEVHGPEGEVVARLASRLTKFGSFAVSYKLPAEARLGRYRLKRKGDSRYSSLGSSFEVAEYHPADFAVGVTLSRQSLKRGEALECKTKGTYLNGGPLAFAKASLRLERRRSYFSPYGFSGYSFGEQSRPEPELSLTNVKVQLDKSGTAAINETLILPGMTGPEEVTCVANIHDLSERALQGAERALVHPGDFYLGIDADPAVIGEKFDASAIAVTTDEQATTADIELELRLRKRKEPNGPFEEARISGCSLAKGTSSCTFTAPEGEYRSGLDELYLFASAKDPSGNLITASTQVWTTRYIEPAPEPQPAAPFVPEPATLSIYGLKDKLELGEEAAFEVRSPFKQAATVRVSVRREDVIEEQMLQLPPSGTRVKFKVSEAMLPNVDVMVTAIAGAEAQRANKSVSISAESRRLSVELTPQTEAAGPGDDLELKLEVTDAAGYPVPSAEVTLWGADEATLMLAMYPTPHPFTDLFEGRAGWLGQLDTRDNPLRIGERSRVNQASVRMGATSVSGRDPRADFRQSVMFEPSLLTDANGQLRHRIKLPDNLTKYRFFAVVATEKDQFGSAETAVATSLPLMARPSLPSVVRVGDTFHTTVVLTNLNLPVAPARVELKAEGVNVVGEASQALTLSPATPARVRFALSAKQAGPFKLTVHAATTAGKAAEDTFIIRGEVVLPALLESSVVTGETKRPIAETLGDLSQLRSDVGGLTISLSDSSLGGATEGLESLLRYPYGCTEQTLSQLLPLVVMRAFAKDFALEFDSDPQALAEQAMARLVSHQRDDGGFGLWAGSRESAPWLTAYAVLVLSEAKTRGMVVPEQVVLSAGNYLQGQLAAADAETASAMLDALATLERPINERAMLLVEQREQLSPAGRAFLLHALVRSRAGTLQREQVQSALLASLRLSGDTARVVAPSERPTPTTFTERLDSLPRASALALRALAASDPEHVLLAPLAKGLLADRVGGRWATTHETGWALLGLSDYQQSRGERPQTFEARAFFGDELLVAPELGAVSGRQTTVKLSMMQLLSAQANTPSPRVTFDVKDGGTLHYQMRLDYARKTLPSEATERGLTVVRKVRRVNPSEAPFVEGEVVRVDIVVASPAARFGVAVESPLPGGFAAVAPELMDADPEHELPQAEPKRVWDGRELRDDRVLFFVDQLPAGLSTFSFYVRALHPGDFLLPPTSAFEMYAPEVRGATATERVTVNAR